MLKQITRLALLSSLLMLAVAAPANASNKNAAKAYRSLAKSVNATHAVWKAAAPQAKLDSQAALAEAEAACLPAFTAAGNIENPRVAFRTTVRLFFAAEAMINSTGTDDSLRLIRNDFLFDKVLPLNEKLRYSESSTSGQGKRLNRGLDAFTDAAKFFDGVYISPTDLCAAAEQWQSNGFASKKEPRSLRRIGILIIEGFLETRPILVVAKELRHYGASANAVGAFTAGFSNPAMGSDSLYQTPLFNALNLEGENAQNSLADIKAQMRALQQK
jgi:hypothetical protein